MRRQRRTKVVATLGPASSSRTVVERLFRAGADVFRINMSHTTHEKMRELVETIRAVHAGQKRLSTGIAADLAEHSTDGVLTPREIEVLRLVAVGNANKEIGAQLSLTEVTVKSHVKNVLAKLGANDRTHAVTIALKRGIIDL